MFNRVVSVALVASLFAVGCAAADIPESQDTAARGGAAAGNGAAGAEGAGEVGGGPNASGTTGAGAAGAAGGGAGGQPGASGGGASGQPGAGGASAISDNAIGADRAPAVVITRADWMSQTPGLANKALNDIFIPGTHDSGTYGLISTYQRPVDDVFAPESEWVKRLGSFVGMTDVWAKAQEKNISEQLADGIRYLDFRPCRENSGDIRVCHGLYGPRVLDLLEDVRIFAEAHPKEIIFIQMGEFNGFKDQAHHDQLGAWVMNRLGQRVLNYGAGEVTPTSKLGDLWRDYPGKSIVILYDGASRPFPIFMPSGSVIHGSWVDTWKKDTKKSSLANALTSPPKNEFLNTSGSVTPDATLISYAADPLSNYPRSLAELADETNPVVFDWLLNEWGGIRNNFLSVDFYNRTCLWELTQVLNGAADKSTLASCKIGPTNWGNWAAGPYGRGAGKPMVCGPNEEMWAGLCYTKCNPGYSWNVAFPYLCTQGCPAGYRDEPLTCMRDVSTVSADTSACKWYDKCGAFTGCSKCPSGYTNMGCTCSRGAHSINKASYNRGIGRIPSSCPAGTEKDGLLCYEPCRTGFVGVGPMCHPEM
ncbi:MAG: hypothetical protein JST00_11765 [Deltaproteobacteria bacterium]|nr:hypothetical protein [Deltaproteobacteria bacterium]